LAVTWESITGREVAMIRAVLSSVAAAAMLSITATGLAYSQKSQPGRHVPLSLGDGSTIEARKGPIQKSKPGGAHVPLSLGDGSTLYGTVRGRVTTDRVRQMGR
jgi:hypothetical protein